MPFDPLDTDEKLRALAPRERDLDSVMLGGCAAFVATALLSYALSVWPFLFMPGVQRLSTLLLAMLAGMAPAAILGVIATRRFGLPGGSGFIAGAATTAVFLVLNLRRVFVLAMEPRTEPPQYSAAAVWLLPLAWLAVAVSLALLAMPKGELLEKERPR